MKFFSLALFGLSREEEAKVPALTSTMKIFLNVTAKATKHNKFSYNLSGNNLD